MTIYNKIKNFFIRVVPCYAPAPCPNCGVIVQVPLTRNPEKQICHLCSKELITMAVGLCDLDEDRLKHAYDEVGMWIGIANAERDMNRSRLH